MKSHMLHPDNPRRTRCGKLRGDIGNFYPIVHKYGSPDATCKMCQRLHAQDLTKKGDEMREIKFIIHSGVVRCPKCENSISFNAHSSQIGEDCCNVWVECGVCGFDPTAENTSLRFEKVFCGTDAENCFMALECWNDAITELLRGDDE